MNEDQLKKLAEAMATADKQCQAIHQLILNNEFSWQPMPGPEGVTAYCGTGGGYTAIIGKGVGNSSIIGSCFGEEAQLTVLRGEFALFCLEAAQAAVAKKN